MIRPSSSFALVLALNCLQNSIMLICACPSAGPTGGAGVALPAAICNFTEPVIFFAISILAFRYSLFARSVADECERRKQTAAFLNKLAARYSLSPPAHSHLLRKANGEERMASFYVITFS